MKTLKHPGKYLPLAVVVLLLSVGRLLSQCTVSAGPDVTKCLNHSFNPGPFVTTSGTTGAITYSWNGTTFSGSPNTSLVPSTTGATTFTITIQDASGCTATDQLTINVLPLPTVNAGADMTVCSGAPVSLCATASSANGAISLYTWTSGPPSQCWNIAPTQPTTYTVTAVDVSQCQKSDQITVFINPLPTVNAGSDQTMCLSQDTLQLTGSPAGGAWSGSGVNASGLYTASSVTTATLTYTAANSNGCSNTDQMQISVSSPSPINGGADLEMCLNSPSVNLPNVGTWSGSASVTPAGVFTPNSAGVHQLIVTSGAASCLLTDMVNITVFALPVVSAGDDLGICTGGNTVINGSASTSNGSITGIVWSGNSLSSTSVFQPTAAPNGTGNYTLTITDSEGCENSDQMTITVNTFSAVSAGNDMSICSNGGEVNLSGFLPSGGTWSGAGVNAAGTFTPSTLGTFNLSYTYTNPAGCTSSDQMAMTVVAPGSVNAGNDVTICLNTPAYQLLSGGAWTGSTWVSPTGLFTPGAVGTYNLTYTASTGMCMASDNIQVLVLNVPTASAGPDQSVCAGTQVQLTASGISPNGAITAFTWTSGLVSDSLINNPVSTPTASTTYTVVVSDAFGCSDDDQITVNVNTYPSIDAGNNIIACLNGSPVALAGFSPAGGTWSGSGVTSGGLFTPAALGNATLTYSFTSASGCTSTDQLTVAVISGGTVDAGNDLDICLNAAPVQLSSTGAWSGSSLVTSGGLFTPNTAGSYTLTYSGMSGGCIVTDQMLVTVLNSPNVSAGADMAACAGSEVQLNATGSSTNGGITGFEWLSAGLSNSSIANPTYQLDESATLTIEVTDAAGCSSTDHITLTANPVPIVTAGNDQSFCNQGIPQQLAGFSPSGGIWTGPYVTGAGVFTPSTTGNNVLTYSFTNAFNCTAADQINVAVTATILADVGEDVSLCAGSAPFQLTTNSSGGSWIPGAHWNSSGNFNPTTTGVFLCTYVLGTGSCANNDIKTVTVHALPTVSAGQDIATCEGASVQLSGSANGQGPFDFLWNNATWLNHPDYPNPTASPDADTWFTLTVEDDHGCTASDAVFVDVVPMPHASIGVDNVACVNAAVGMTNNSTNSVSYTWSLGNSTSSSLLNPSATYAVSGVYTIELTAYNAAGCSDVTSETIEVISAPQASFTPSVSTGCTPLNVSFENQTTGNYYTSAWNLGGTTYSGETPPASAFVAEQFTTTYEIALTTTNLCGSDDYSEQIVVDPAPHAEFSTDLSSQCSPVTMVFNNTSQGNPQYFHWDLGDGDTSDDPVPAPKVYVSNDDDDDSEIFTITLTAYNECGSDSESSEVLVLPNTVHMNMEPSVPVGCSPLFVEFINNTSGATNFLYDFGDNTNSTQTSPNHLFTDAGEYNVVLYANDGCSYDTTSLTITVVQSPSIAIAAEEDAVCPFTPVHFHSTPVGNISQTDWFFGDGIQQTEEDPIHEYASGNTYYVSVTTYDQNGCPATASLELLVYPQPEANISLSTNEDCSPATICTSNESTGAQEYFWDFGNGFTSTDELACFQYINTSIDPENFVVSVDVENEFGCTDHAQEDLVILPQPLISFLLSSDESCLLMQSVTTNTESQNAVAFEWFADGQLTSQAFNPVFQFDEVGVHEVSALAYNEFGCSDMHADEYTIHPTPAIDIMPEVFNGCAPLTVAFENETTDGAAWAWTFSNGGSSAFEFPTVTFADPGKYDVQLIATSQHGCQQVQYYEEMIEVFPVPVADFTMDPDDEIIYDLDVAFTNASEGAVVYYWNFGDGLSDRAIDPVHHFRAGGYFIVTLRAENEFGCSSEMQKPVNIDNAFYMFMPNSFTPDDDGLNDVFMPEFNSKLKIESYEFVVMNRWGEIVFSTNDPGDGWIGNIRGGDHYAHNDVFTWSVEIDFNNKQIGKSFKGSVLVLR